MHPIQKMKEGLKPRGTANLVRMKLEGFYYESFISAAIEQLEKQMHLASIGMVDELSPLEKLGVEALMQSSDVHLHPARQKDNS